MYKLIEKNKRNSIFLFSAVTAVLIALGYFIGLYLFGESHSYAGVLIALAIALITGLVSYYGGDAVILGISTARKVTKEQYQVLYNVIEELTIASGLPMPKIYVIEDSAPNAFATGRDPKHASVAITTGLLDKLNREELQGVMAHEMSHVQNYDILFGTMIAVMVGSIVMLSDFFLRSMFYSGNRRRSRDSGKGGGVMLLIALVLAVIAPFLAKIIQFAVSRQREYLADSSAAKMTRNPIGLANALSKIANDTEPLEAANKGTQHLYIVNPLKKMKKTSGIFDTHPPLEERVRRLKGLHLGINP